MTPQEKKLLKLLSSLSEVDRSAVVAFAEYLHHRQQGIGTATSPSLPVAIARPAGESVPAALKRLRLSYPMLEAADLLAEAADLLSQHLMLGRSASGVIDDMEALFLRHYQHYRAHPAGI
jgi:hypothetical protein